MTTYTVTFTKEQAELLKEMVEYVNDANKTLLDADQSGVADSILEKLNNPDEVDMTFTVKGTSI